MVHVATVGGQVGSEKVLWLAGQVEGRGKGKTSKHSLLAYRAETGKWRTERLEYASQRIVWR